MKQQNQALIDEEVKRAANKSQVLYQCQGCQNMFASIKDVNGHMCRGKKTGKFELAPETSVTMPKVSRNYSCTKCSAHFTTLLALNTHEKTHLKVVAIEPVKYVECTICKLQFPSDDKLQSHMESHKRVRCRRCIKLFKSQEEFTKHIAVTAKLHADFCLTCSRIFSNKEALDAHLLQEHAQTDASEHVALRVIYACQCCNQEYSDMKSFSDHKAGHGIDQFEEVYESNKEFNPSGEVTLQVGSTVTETRVAKISKPATPKKSKLASTDHSYSLSTAENPIIIDDDDDDDLDNSNANDSTTVNDTDDHEVFHTPATKNKKQVVATTDQQAEKLIDKTKPCVFECGMCDVRANSLENLIQHFQSHKDKPITCKHCNITLPSVAALSKHLQYHTKSSQGVECMVGNLIELILKD